MSAGNALAAAYISTTYLGSRAHGKVVVNHAPIAGMIYDIVCTAY
jgi:hypothetical protein